MPSNESAAKTGSDSAWSRKYGEKHQLQRITQFPKGIQGPRRIRLYQRTDHYVLQWWDPAARKTLSDRVNGDLVAAIARSREIEERLEHFRSGRTGRARLRHEALVNEFLEDLRRRCRGGEVSTRTVDRYSSALQHYLAFATEPSVESKYHWAANVDRRFVQEFRAFLAERQVSPNGHAHTAVRPLSSQSYVVDVVRSMFRWAADPSRGNSMPTGFQNPFVGGKSREERRRRDLFSEPDVTVDMAIQFLMICDPFQLRLFAPLILYGLRASEPCLVFREDVQEGWLHVLGHPEIGYDTKGLCDKRLPLVDPLPQLLLDTSHSPASPLLFPRRAVWEGKDLPPLGKCSFPELIAEYQLRIRKNHKGDSAFRNQIQRQIVQDAGGMDYDHLQGEFLRLTKQLNWPKKATLKDFRHLFSTSLENAGVPLFYRRYLMGQSPGKSAIVTYTHVNELRQQYQRAVDRSLGPICEAVAKRMRELRLAGELPEPDRYRSQPQD